jgi:hypothetical protein
MQNVSDRATVSCVANDALRIIAQRNDHAFLAPGSPIDKATPWC